MGVLLQGLREGAEDYPVLGQLLAEGGGDGHAVEDGVNGHAGQPFLLFQRDAQLLIGAEKLGVHLVQALEFLLSLGSGVVDNVLVVDGRVVDLGPGGGLLLVSQLYPVTEGFEAPLQHELRLVFLGGDPADDVLVETFGSNVSLDVRDEAVPIFLGGNGV